MTLARSRTDSPARRLSLLGALLTVPLVAAAGLAWACVPTARVALDRISGPGGVVITMSGSGFPSNAFKVDIYLNSKQTPPVVDDLPMTIANGEASFSTQVTVPNTVGAHLLIPVPRDSSDNDVGTVSNGAGPPAAVYQVTDPSLTAAPGSGRVGTKVTVSGSQFRSGEVALHWDSADGPLLGSAVATGTDFSFTRQITVPAGAVGAHKIVGVPFGDPQDTASAPFRVLASPPPPPAVADSVGPAIVAAALSSGNGTKTVSKKGAVTIFCGQFAEAGVTGECGATSVKKLKVATASRSARLKLQAKSFSAEAGKPVKVKFRLKKASMRMLRRAKKVRMRGTVTARDAKGNASPVVGFRFTLKAPKARR